MQGKLITLMHHQDDCECMWNGIDDLYIRDTGEKLPPSFFFNLSSFGSFCYMKTPNSDIKRLIVLGDGRTKMYEFLVPIAGFEYKHYEYKTFEQAIKKAGAEVDAGYPPVLGALDMYYLPYFPKLYHEELTKEDYDKILVNMVTFFGAVPTVPNALRGINEPDEVSFGGGFEKMSRVLNDLGGEYRNKAWLEAAGRFDEGAVTTCEIKNVIVGYLTLYPHDNNETEAKVWLLILEKSTKSFICQRTHRKL